MGGGGASEREEKKPKVDFGLAGLDGNSVFLLLVCVCVLLFFWVATFAHILFLVFYSFYSPYVQSHAREETAQLSGRPSSQPNRPMRCHGDITGGFWRRRKCVTLISGSFRNVS